MFIHPFSRGFRVVPGVITKPEEFIMVGITDAYYVLTKAHASLVNAVLHPANEDYSVRHDHTQDFTNVGTNTHAQIDTHIASTALHVSTTEETNWNDAYNKRVDSWTAPLGFSSNTASITQATTSTNGYLSSTDWNTFNSKEAALTFSTGLTRTVNTITTNDSQINHNALANTHNLTTDINHSTITNTHNLTTDIDHDATTNFVANEHIDWTNATSNFSTTGTANIDGNVDIGGGLDLDNATSNLITFRGVGLGEPSDSSAGFKIKLWDSPAANWDLGIGISEDATWFMDSIPRFEFWYNQATPAEILAIDATGIILEGTTSRKITFDTNDFISYNTASNYWSISVGGTERFQLYGSGATAFVARGNLEPYVNGGGYLGSANYKWDALVLKAEAACPANYAGLIYFDTDNHFYGRWGTGTEDLDAFVYWYEVPPCLKEERKYIEAAADCKEKRKRKQEIHARKIVYMNELEAVKIDEIRTLDEAKEVLKKIIKCL